MPIKVITFPEVEGVTEKVRADFIKSLLVHRVFAKSRAAGKSHSGIVTAVDRMGAGSRMQLAAEDCDRLQVAADTPEYPVFDVDATGKQNLKGYEEGFQVMPAGVVALMPILDAIMEAEEETADAPKAAPTPEAPPPNGAPAAGALVVPETAALDMPKAAVSS